MWLLIMTKSAIAIVVKPSEHARRVLVLGNILRSSFLR